MRSQVGNLGAFQDYFKNRKNVIALNKRKIRQNLLPFLRQADNHHIPLIRVKSFQRENCSVGRLWAGFFFQY